jgi:fibronectin type 3 domain-containing protein
LTTDTDADGKFTAEGVILGDAYKLTPEGGTSVTVIPTSEGDDIGVIAITSGVNFKTSLIPSQSAQSSADMTELYINETYQFDLEFENTGDEDCPAPSYAITAPSGVTITGNLQGILGTIEPGVKKSVPIGVWCSAVAGDYEYKKINVTIRDGTGKTWEDSVSLRFYRETLDFNIKAEKPVSGIVISPDAKTYSFTDVTDGVVSAPRRTTGDYLVVFSGATIETETRYSLGVGVGADGAFSTFIDTSRYEPNNTEGTAVALDTQNVMAYLYKNDIDYYRVSYSNVDVPSRPTGISASAADAEVTVTWTVVDGATSYNVYRVYGSIGFRIGTSKTASYTYTVTSKGTYEYEVSAVSASGFESARSDRTEVAVTPPSTPTGVSTSVADAEVTVSWNAVTGASSYNVYRSGSQTETSTKVGASTTASYTDTVAGVGTYHYEVSAVSAGGLESVYSDRTEVAVTAPAVPTNVSASTEDGEVTVSWNAVTGASSYNISRSDSSDGTYTQVGTSTSPSYTETVGATGIYYYRVNAESAGGFESAFSDSATVTVTIDIEVTNLPETLSWLSANAVDSGYYALLLGKDETTPPQTLSYSGMNIMIVLKGKGGERTVSLEGDGSLFTVGSGVTLVLEDGATLKGHSSNTTSLVMVSLGGNLVLNDGGAISGNTVSSSPVYGGGVYVDEGTFTMNGGTISGNTIYTPASAAYGGGVYVNNGTFTMNGGTINGNTASSSYYGGGGVAVFNGTFTMSGGEISGNTASATGGGVFISGGGGGGTFTMSDGTISGNTANYGGGVFIEGTFTMNDGEISGNTASASGGGVYVKYGTSTMSGGEISGNTTSYGGGGVYADQGSFIKQSGGIIYGSNADVGLKNTANYGSAVYVNGSYAKQRNTTAGVGVRLDSWTSGSAGGWQ